MAKLLYASLFDWQDIAELGDLKRLKLVLDNVEDEDLMRALERTRGKGRNDYPVRVVWNSLLAGIVFQHPSIESLRRELCRNAQLRQVCGFHLITGKHLVPPARAYSNLLSRLAEHTDLVGKMFVSLVEQLGALLPGFGERVALDSKAVESHGNKPSDENNEEPDGRRDTDADYGKKTYKGTREDGTAWNKTVSWFGYKVHMLVDADYELPVAYDVTPASHSDIAVGRELVDDYSQTHPSLTDRCCFLSADKAYDDTTFITKLYDKYGIKPVIAIRNQWKDGEPTRLASGTQNVVYTYDGEVRCHCLLTGKERLMPNGGFEKDRMTLKFRCPAQHYGCECKSFGRCPVKTQVRIKLDEDRRVFTPLHRQTYDFPVEYKKRTSVERVNSRLDVSFGFEQHYIRGLKKMRIRTGMALIVMLSMALGRAQENKERLRSLVAAA